MILVGGIGNVFLGDDGFGVEVVRRMRERPVPDSVRVVDFGIRGIDLAFALPAYESVILVDTVARGQAPGTLYVIEPALGESGRFDLHGMTPDRVLRWVDPVEAPRMLRIVGCEPATFGQQGIGHEGLSDPVLAAVGGAIELVDGLIAEVLRA
jgi:hydrogenase maturation protease